ncbi:MAG: TatD family hydrolase [Candidatus Micrarchaeaceae archaeon]
MFSDAHCHLYMADKITQIINESLECNVGLFLNTAVDIESCEKIIKTINKNSVYGVLGISPDFSLSQLNEVDKLESILKNAIAIGEIGLDNKINVPINIQKRCFEKQLDLAVKNKLPVVIHSRGTLQLVEKILEDKNIEKAMFHFFEGNEEVAKRLEKKGYLLSIPPLDYSRYSRVIKSVDLNTIVCETDFPAVGKTPCEVLKTIKKIAEIKNKEITFVGELITQTIKAYFDI